MHQAINLGNAITVINNKIVCLSLQNTGVKIGDTIIARTPNDIYYDGQIEEIQVDRVNYTELEPVPTVNVGIKVPFRAKANQTFLLVRQ